MRWIRRLITLVRRRHVQEDFEDEVGFHLDQLTQRYQAQGLTLEAAAAKARQQFGDPLVISEQADDVWFGRWLVDALQDLRYAARILIRQPAFSAIAISTLAIAIAANTAIFSVVHAVMLRPLPFRDPSRLVVIWNRDARQKGSAKLFAQYRDLEHWRAHSRTVEQVAGLTWAVASPVMTGHGPARSVLAVPSTAELFPLLGVGAQVGRTFDTDDATRGCSLVLAYRFWRDVLGSPADLAALRLALDTRACVVVGVMPADFIFYPDATEMWRLITPTDPLVRDGDAAGGLAVLARLAPRVTLAAAQADVQRLSRGIDRGIRYGAEMEPVVYPLQTEFTFLAGPNLTITVLVLTAAVVVLLLIACMNVANLLMGRALARGRELAIRIAIGSGRGRLVRQLLTESLMLSALATVVGVALAAGLILAFRSLAPVQLPPGARVEMSMPVLMFAVGLAIVTTVLFGLWPAWNLSRPGAPQGLIVERSGSSGPHTRGVVKSLVVAEVGLSFVLLVGGALLLESVMNFSAEPLGFDPTRLVFETIRLPGADYATLVQRSAFFDRAKRALSLDPDVEQVAFSTALPLRGGQGMAALIVDGHPIPPAGALVPDVSGQVVSAEYLPLMGIGLERGRLFSSVDQLSGQPVAIINAAAARRYFPNDDPVGQRVKFYGDSGPSNPWLTIVGVATNEKRHRPDHEMAWVDAPIVYRAFDQSPPRSANLLIRLRVRDGGRGAAIQRELTNIDPAVVIGDVETARHFVDRYFAYPQFRAALLVAFAGTALVLALVGLYGVLSQLVSQRGREIGIRMALGATRLKVLVLIAGEGMRLMVLGVLAGLVAALWTSTLLSSALFGVAPRDVRTLTLVAVALFVTSFVAVIVPAIRAASTDPIVAIRQE